MPICIYCAHDKPQAEMSLEHAIPRFLGGMYSPLRFQIRNCCEKCNNLLGLFVDASFARTPWIAGWMRFAAYSAYDRANPTALPLMCLGPCELKPPGIQENEVCESWLGPQGEQVYWIRPHAERFYWYIGGDPINAKRLETRAYFYLGPGSLRDPMKTWLSFKEAFESTRVKKVMCTSVTGAVPADIGFCDIDELDERRIRYFADHCTEESSSRLISISMKMDFDFRFAAKLALSLGYSVFGDSYLDREYTRVLRKAVWFHDRDEPMPTLRGQTPLQSKADPTFLRATGRPNLVAITITQTHSAIAAILNIGQQHCWSLMISPDREKLDPAGMEWIGAGQVILLAPSVQVGVSMTWPEFFAHNAGIRNHEELAALEPRLTVGALPADLNAN